MSLNSSDCYQQNTYCGSNCSSDSESDSTIEAGLFEERKVTEVNAGKG